MLAADEIGEVPAAPVRRPWKPGEGTLVTLRGDTDPTPTPALGTGYLGSVWRWFPRPEAGKGVPGEVVTVQCPMSQKMTVLRVGGKVASVPGQSNSDPGEVVQTSGKVAVVSGMPLGEAPRTSPPVSMGPFGALYEFHLLQSNLFATPVFLPVLPREW